MNTTIARRITMLRYTLMGLLTTKGCAYFDVDGEKYILNGITREDGSGYLFNVECTHSHTHERHTFFVRTN